MSNKKDDIPLDLSSLDFGPAWARSKDDSKKRYEKFEGRGERPARGGKGGPRGKGGSAHRGQKRRDQGTERRPRGGDFKSKGKDGSDRRPRREEVPVPEGLIVDIMPVEEGVDNLAKQIVDTGRTYSVFDLARVILGGRERFNVVYRQEEGGPKVFQCRKEPAVFLTKEECLAHFATADWRVEVYTEEKVEADAPTGNFKGVARCGFSGELLGPPNYHGYQTRVIEIHAERFSNMTLDRYKSRIKVEQGEEIVAEWQESMKFVTKYTEVDGDATFDSMKAMQGHFVTSKFDEIYHETHRADVIASVPAKHLSPALLTGLKAIVVDQRRYPGKLASFLCRQMSGRQLAVFKWQGKLHAGPSRPHAIPEGLTMAERPQSIVSWVEENSGAGIDKLWEAVLPEDVTDELKKEWYHDLHWLINQGYILLMSEGFLFTADKKSKASSNTGKKAKKKATSENVAQAKANDTSSEIKTDAAKIDAKADAKTDAKVLSKEELKEELDAKGNMTVEAKDPASPTEPKTE